jgi:hypothetical protein
MDITLATEQASEMRRKLEHLTPAQLGFPGMTADELIASEYRCWLDAELEEDRKRGK